MRFQKIHEYDNPFRWSWNHGIYATACSVLYSQASKPLVSLNMTSDNNNIIILYIISGKMQFFLQKMIVFQKKYNHRLTGDSFSANEKNE